MTRTGPDSNTTEPSSSSPVSASPWAACRARIAAAVAAVNASPGRGRGRSRARRGWRSARRRPSPATCRRRTPASPRRRAVQEQHRLAVDRVQRPAAADDRARRRQPGEGRVLAVVGGPRPAPSRAPPARPRASCAPPRSCARSAATLLASGVTACCRSTTSCASLAHAARRSRRAGAAAPAALGRVVARAVDRLLLAARPPASRAPARAPGVGGERRAARSRACPAVVGHRLLRLRDRRGRGAGREPDRRCAGVAERAVHLRLLRERLPRDRLRARSGTRCRSPRSPAAAAAERVGDDEGHGDRDDDERRRGGRATPGTRRPPRPGPARGPASGSRRRGGRRVRHARLQRCRRDRRRALTGRRRAGRPLELARCSLAGDGGRRPAFRAAGRSPSGPSGRCGELGSSPWPGPPVMLIEARVPAPNCGSGKSVTPCERMHFENASAWRLRSAPAGLRSPASAAACTSRTSAARSGTGASCGSMVLVLPWITPCALGSGKSGRRSRACTRRASAPWRVAGRATTRPPWPPVRPPTAVEGGAAAARGRRRRRRGRRGAARRGSCRRCSRSPRPGAAARRRSRRRSTRGREQCRDASVMRPRGVHEHALARLLGPRVGATRRRDSRLSVTARSTVVCYLL